jgi:hypothetical protein
MCTYFDLDKMSFIIIYTSETLLQPRIAYLISLEELAEWHEA